MRAVIIGTGHIANNHIIALNYLGVSVNMVVDADYERSKNFSQKWQIPSYEKDYRKAFIKGVDVIHVCTPPESHFEIVSEALKAGKHVICEKPLCLDSEHAIILEKLAKNSGKVCAVNFNNRFYETCKRSKKIVEKEEFGSIFMIHGSYLQEFHALPAEFLWRYHSKMRAITEIGSHWFDLARYISGKEIVAVSASFGNFNPKRYLKDDIMYKNEIPGSKEIIVSSEDAAFISLKFSDGFIGNVVFSEVSQGRTNRLHIEITGLNKSIWWNSETPNCLHTASKGEGVKSKNNPFGSGFTDTFKAFFAEVYKDIKMGALVKKPIYANFTDGMQNVLICNAIYKSATSNSLWIDIAQQNHTI